jgi:hypothetical protein
MENEYKEPDPSGCVEACCYLDGPENSLVSSSIVQGIRNHCGVLLEVEWSEICHGQQMENLVTVCYKTDGLVLQTFHWDKFARWAANGS